MATLFHSLPLPTLQPEPPPSGFHGVPKQLQFQSFETRMACRSSLKIAYVAVAVICSSMAVKAALASDCIVSGDFNERSYAEAASPATRHRKALVRSATEERGRFEGIERLKKEGETVAGRWKLREVPLGPDPMHHHGNPPKKPRTP